MKFFKFSAFKTSKLWEFPDPDVKNRVHVGSTRSELLTRIIQYRVQNRLPLIDELDTVVDNYLCKHPMNSGSCEEVKTLSRGLMGYYQGGVALLKNLMFRRFATQEEADRRAEICISCPYNVFPDRGGFLKWSDDIANASVGDRRSVHHDKLGSCDVCSCTLKAKIFYEGKLELTEEMLKKMPGECWQLQKFRKDVNGSSK